MKFILMPLGSAGDVHPFVWLGKLLRGRGHEVVMVVQEVVAEISERSGLRTVAWGKKGEQEEILKNADIWHPQKAFPLLMGFLPQWAREMMPVIRGELEGAEGRVVLVGGTLALGAPLASEKWNVPLISVHLQPSLFMSVEELPVMAAGFEWLSKSPRWVRRAFVTLGGWKVDGIMRPGIRKAREEAGLPVGKLKGLMNLCWHSRDGEVCLFPEWFARKASDWPAAAVTTRFPLYDESQERPIDEELERFLAAGEMPVIITPGSANAHGGEFIREAVGACGLLGKRALVVTRFPEQVGALPAGSASFEYVPFGRVFGRGAAVVHHGGVGTMAQCLAAGVPQLIMPMSHDQPDNANRVKRMGVGDFLYPKAFKAARIAEKLRGLTGSTAVREACAERKGMIAEQMSEGAMGELMEGMGERGLRVRGN